MLVAPTEVTPEETAKLVRLRYLGEDAVEDRLAVAAALRLLLANIIE